MFLLSPQSWQNLMQKLFSHIWCKRELTSWLPRLVPSRPYHHPSIRTTHTHWHAASRQQPMRIYFSTLCCKEVQCFLFSLPFPPPSHLPSLLLPSLPLPSSLLLPSSDLFSSPPPISSPFSALSIHLITSRSTIRSTISFRAFVIICSYSKR